jgi:hypothetical protein
MKLIDFTIYPVRFNYLFVVHDFVESYVLTEKLIQAIS